MTHTLPVSGIRSQVSRDIPGYITGLPQGFAAGDEIPPDDALYTISILKDGGVFEMPNRLIPTDARWSDVPGIELLLVPKLGTPVTIRDVQGIYELHMGRQEFPAVFLCGEGSAPARGPGIVSRAVTGIMSGFRGLFDSTVVGGGPAMARTASQILNLEILGEQMIFDCEGLDTLSIQYNVIEGTITDAVVTVQRSLHGNYWTGFPSAVLLTDGEVEKDIDVYLLKQIRIRVTTAETMGAVLARAEITADVNPNDRS